ncbi:MAG: hypothetical protein ACKVI5_04500 [Nitrospinaceae bacterium]|jgi:hypothetical protein|tara:strand:+ start:1297 stop:1533 length:237 start_codon:yes stop_codon:yes gene_type:complete
MRYIFIILSKLLPTSHNNVYSSQVLMPFWFGMGHCGREKLKYKKDIVVPIQKYDELFFRVKGPGINNTDINTIIGQKI